MPRPRPVNSAESKGTNVIDQVLSAVQAVLNREHSDLVFDTIYHNVDKICGSRQEQQLADNLTRLLSDRFNEWLTELKKQTGDSLIALFSTQFDSLNVYIRIIPKIFGSYDAKVTSIGRANLQARNIIRNKFFEIIYSNTATMDTVASTMLSSYLSFRKRTFSDFSVVKNLVRLFYDFRDFAQSDRFQTFKESLESDTLDFYNDYFESTYIGQMVDYLENCRQMLEYEKKIDDFIFEPKEAHDIRLVAFSALFVNDEDKFFVGIVPPISQALTSQTLQPLKWLLSYYNEFEISTDKLIEVLTVFVKNQMLSFKSLFLPPEPKKKEAGAKKAPAKKGTAAKKAPAKKEEAAKDDADKKEDPGKKIQAAAPDTVKHMDELIHRTVELADNFNSVFCEIKDAKERLETQIKEAWNCKEFNAANNFVLFCDYHLKAEMKGLNQKDIDTFPQMCKDFVTRTEDKEHFKTAYESYLLRRIIKQGEKTKKQEELIIKEVRKVIQEFIKPFESYYKTVKESKDILDKFVSEVGKIPGDIQFAPILFKNQDFHLQKEEVKKVPQFIQEVHQLFSDFYEKQQSNLKLTMLSDLSTLTFRIHIPQNAKAPPRTYTVSCDIICGSILYTIAANKNPSLVDIFQAVPFKHEDIKPYIKRLCEKNRQLIVRIKDESSKDDKVLKDTDRFQLNPKFFYKSTQVVVPPIDHNAEKIQKDTNKNKDIIMKAAGIRCLKQRNIVTRAELENEIIQQSSQFFRPQIDAVRTIIKLLQFDDSEKFCKELPDGRLQYIR